MSEELKEDKVVVNIVSSIRATLNEDGVSTESPTNISTSNEETKKQNTREVEKKRMRHTSFQARMGRKMDKISRKLIDNQIRLTSNPIDMLRIKVTRDERTHDLISRTIEDAEVIPIVFPKLENLPLRHFLKDGEDITIPSLIPYDFNSQQYFEIYVPMIFQLDEDDLIIRVIFDEASDRSWVMAFQVKELLGNIGSSSIRTMKYWVTLYDEPLSKEIVKIITKATNKRETLQW